MTPLRNDRLAASILATVSLAYAWWMPATPRPPAPALGIHEPAQREASILEPAQQIAGAGLKPRGNTSRRRVGEHNPRSRPEKNGRLVPRSIAPAHRPAHLIDSGGGVIQGHRAGRHIRQQTLPPKKSAPRRCGVSLACAASSQARTFSGTRSPSAGSGARAATSAASAPP